MIIIFEEKDRKRIEATGYRIIQAKQVLYTLQKFFNNIIERALNCYNGLSSEQKIEFLKLVLSDNKK